MSDMKNWMQQSAPSVKRAAVVPFMASSAGPHSGLASSYTAARGGGATASRTSAATLL
jgi:hypothetical protein